MFAMLRFAIALVNEVLFMKFQFLSTTFDVVQELIGS